MFKPIVEQMTNYNFSIGAGQQLLIPVMRFLDTQGVKSGALVVRMSVATLTGTIQMNVKTAQGWPIDASSQVPVSQSSLASVGVVQASGGNPSNTYVKVQAFNAGEIPTPGLAVVITVDGGGSGGSISANLSIGLELLPT